MEKQAQIPYSGVQRISAAVDQMTQVTRQVAANAEESASAAEELTAQATCQ
jgi:methyl-accepting chemotaxis protein